LRKYGEYMLNINKIFVAYRLFKENYLQKEYLHDITWFLLLTLPVYCYLASFMNLLFEENYDQSQEDKLYHILNTIKI